MQEFILAVSFSYMRHLILVDIYFSADAASL
jgi:hypothetical protein